MKRCSILLLCALSASTYANYKTLSPNYRDYFTVNFANMTPAASLLTVEGSVTLENLNCNSTKCTFDLYGGSGEEDTGVASVLLGTQNNGFCTVVIPDGSKVTDVKIYPACVRANSTPLQQRAHSHEYSFTINGNTPYPPPQTKYNIGDWAEGGVIIDLDVTGERGLVAANQDTGVAANTWEDVHQYCLTYQNGYKDWRLPEIDELALLLHEKLYLPFLNLDLIYWSNTPWTGTGAHWTKGIKDGAFYKYGRSNGDSASGVCVRTFGSW